MTTIADRQYKSTWLGRSLENYKAMHQKTAERKGVSAEFNASRTLTQAKKVLYGYKKSNAR